MSNKEEIKTLVNKILESRSNTKLIPDLIQALSEPNVSKPALNGLLKVFTHLIKKGDLKPMKSKDESDPAYKYSSWLCKVFDEAFEKVVDSIGTHIDEKNIASNDLYLTTSIKLLVAAHDEIDPEKKNWNNKDTNRFRKILETLISHEKNNSNQIERFQEYLEYPDAKNYTIQILAKMAHKHNTKEFRMNMLKILEILNFDGTIPVAEGLIIKDFKVSDENVGKNFNILWQEFSKQVHQEVEIYKRILILLTDKVMPVLKNPLFFTDFLMNSYNVGGAISLLALNGVFFLITKHNLEYPDFYKKLYSLCTPELMHAKYRARFFYLANLFLASSHLPEYLVAAFVKRFSRLCLTAPANSILLVLPFIGNLLLRHKGLVKMIDNTEEHFIMDEPDPAKSKAVESGLWEIKTLQNHTLPQVAQAAKFINKGLPQMEWNIAEYLETSYEDMFSTEAKKKIFVNVPLTFERPNGLAFPKNDVLSNHFVI